MWNSFKKSARKFRSRSREKVKNKSKEERLSNSNPDLSNGSESPPGTAKKEKGFDKLFEDAEKRQRQSGEEDGGQGSSERVNSKESEVDSGIAVVENVSYFIHFE